MSERSMRLAWVLSLTAAILVVLSAVAMVGLPH